MKRVRLGAVAATWLAASLAAGLGSSAEGLAPGVLGGYGIVGLLDSTLGWLLITLAPGGLALVLFFLPFVLLLEAHGVRQPLAFIAAGVLAGIAWLALFVSPSNYGNWILLLPVPGAVAGLTWWLLVIRRQAESSFAHSAGRQNG